MVALQSYRLPKTFFTEANFRVRLNCVMNQKDTMVNQVC